MALGFTVIATVDESSDQYLKKVLGESGVNTFPSYKGKCGCGTEVRSNATPVRCPGCGDCITLLLEESYSSWSYNHPSR